ncbi:arylamine N-acetyltransferase family protein [Paenibacillus terrigena]|uniref:arylamine N-acetyltransferase family protein n=1 Tax=Paenibacillus terrigena TaxID=369333 RepID=UPI000368271C|nr:arylamine N-acetyltransferase [Paenibacillus terrigena]
MTDLNALFRQRIGLPEEVEITFDLLDQILVSAAKTIPFENFCIVKHRPYPISRESLIRKILIHQEGGLCYELNMLLNFFLIEHGFHMTPMRGIVFNHETQTYLPIGRTHVTLLMTHEHQSYVIDTGFGGNLPLTPVPLTGETVTSGNGEFRITPGDGEHGNYVLEMKMKHKHTDWRIGYAFDTQQLITNLSELNTVQQIISEHPDSRFNRYPLITRRTDQGQITLTGTSFTQWEDGIMTKEPIDRIRFEKLLSLHFGLVY